MNSNIKANVSVMFETIEPWDVSGSVAELGRDAAQITWGNAMRIAGQAPAWLLTPIDDACEAMRGWAKETGAWDREEIDAMSSQQFLALLVQNIASELRMLGSDDNDLLECVTTYQETDWDAAPEYPVGFYSADCNDDVHVDYYTFAPTLAARSTA